MKFIIAVALECIGIFAGSASPGYCQKATTVDTCSRLLRSYSVYWKNDSLAKNGFGELMGIYVLRNCEYNGKAWTELQPYLGPPNFTYSESEKIRYRYRLNHFTEDVTDSGTFLLDVVVNKEGII